MSFPSSLSVLGKLSPSCVRNTSYPRLESSLSSIFEKSILISFSVRSPIYSEEEPGSEKPCPGSMQTRLPFPDSEGLGSALWVVTLPAPAASEVETGKSSSFSLRQATVRGIIARMARAVMKHLILIFIFNLSPDQVTLLCRAGNGKNRKNLPGLSQ